MGERPPDAPRRSTEWQWSFPNPPKYIRTAVLSQAQNFIKHSASTAENSRKDDAWQDTKDTKERAQTKEGGRRPWGAMYDKFVRAHRNGAVTDELDAFMKADDALVSVVGWDRHARVMYKHHPKKQVIVLDPWERDSYKRKAFKDIADHLWATYKYKCVFLNRKAEQATNGTCGYLALARAVAIAEAGIQTAHSPLPEHCVLLAFAAVQQFAPRQPDSSQAL